MLIFAAIGCSNLPNLSSSNSNIFQDRGNASNSSSRDAKPVENSLKGKTNLYIKDCVNVYSDDVSRNFDDYKEWVKDLDKGPTGKETNVQSGFQISHDGQDCVDAINQAKALKPALPDVETHADSYGVALKEAVSRINEIYPYYSRGDYKDDKFERAKEAHPALIKAYRDFQTADKAFQEDIDKLEDQVAQDDLKEFGNDPSQRYQYLVVETGIKAKKILKEVDKSSFNQLDAETMQPLIDDFARSVDALLAAKESVKSNVSVSTSLYPSSCEEFLKSSKELMRRVRDKKPFSEIDLRMGAMTTGTPQNIVSKYNDMIRYRSL